MASVLMRASLWNEKTGRAARSASMEGWRRETGGRGIRWSTCPPGVSLFAELEVDERLCGANLGQRPDPFVDDLQQVVVVRADHLDQEVEGTRGHDHVVHLLHRGQRLGDRV